MRKGIRGFLRSDDKSARNRHLGTAVKGGLQFIVRGREVLRAQECQGNKLIRNRQVNGVLTRIHSMLGTGERKMQAEDARLDHLQCKRESDRLFVRGQKKKKNGHSACTEEGRTVET